MRIIDKRVKTVKGKLTISSPSQGFVGSRYVSIVIEDANSSCRIVDIQVPVEEFANAMFALAYRPCKVTVFKSAVKLLGKKLEVKSELIKCGRPEKWDMPWPPQEAVAPYEVDGWKVQIDPRFNNHRTEGHRDGNYRTSFNRYVKAPKKAKGAKLSAVQCDHCPHGPHLPQLCDEHACGCGVPTPATHKDPVEAPTKTKRGARG